MILIPGILYFLPYHPTSVSQIATASFSVSVECIHSAFSKLKLSKSDGSILVSDHLVLCLPAIAQLIAYLFTAMIHHSLCPNCSCRDCTLVPIPKSGKDPSSSESYRAIALAPTLSKALEWCLLLQFLHQFSTSDLQFGFKHFMSTSLCSGTVKILLSITFIMAPLCLLVCLMLPKLLI